MCILGTDRRFERPHFECSRCSTRIFWLEFPVGLAKPSPNIFTAHVESCSLSSARVFHCMVCEGSQILIRFAFWGGCPAGCRPRRRLMCK